MKLIKKGAEAILYLNDNKIVKERIKKNYRIKEIDDLIRSFRNKREVKLLEKAKINVPKVISFSDKDMKIEMEYIKGSLLRDVFDDVKGRRDIFLDIGKNISTLHNNGTIHGDLTTANMILKDNKVYFIDFGLGFFSDKIEDKAVDIYLLREVLEGEHDVSVFNDILEGYKNCEDYDKVIDRLKKVERRGRYKER